jgi:ABC-2 type transport system ATP-binding protein
MTAAVSPSPALDSAASRAPRALAAGPRVPELGAALETEKTADGAISVRALRKSYGALAAVCGIDFTVEPGEIFGLIGADGAGKTTTFQILAGVMEASSGTAAVFGHPARDMRAQTGYLTQSFSLYPDLSVAENIRYIGDLRLIPPHEIAERGHRYLRMFDMDRFSDRLAGKLSGGMKQKLSLVSALVPQPRVLLLDEPTTGVDPVSRRELWDALVHLAADGLTILVATPYLDEAERCHRVAFLHRGVIQQIGTPAELRGSLGATRLELRTTDLGAAAKALATVCGPGLPIDDIQRFGDRLDLLVHDPDRASRTVEKTLASAGLAAGDLSRDEPLLENVLVARLRSLGDEVSQAPFPGRHDHSALKGQVAIGGDRLSKQFGAFTAVDGVSLEVRYGEVYGLLGANGAGKTTAIRMLCGLLDPSQGQVQLAGERHDVRSPQVRQRVGYMSQKFSLYDDLPLASNLQFFAGVYGVPPEERAEKIRWVVSFAGLTGKEDRLIGSLPTGWKQRVAFGAAIMHEPCVLFLDEPTSGVDPLARRAFWTLINRLADSGTAILVTTHYLEEAEQCNRLGMMVAGELVAEGSPTGIKSQQPGHLLEIVTDQPQHAEDLLRTTTERWRVSLFGERLHVISDDPPAEALRATTAQLTAAGIQVRSAKESRISLEDAFIHIVERARLQGKVAAED